MTDNDKRYEKIEFTMRHRWQIPTTLNQHYKVYKEIKRLISFMYEDGED